MSGNTTNSTGAGYICGYCGQCIPEGRYHICPAMKETSLIVGYLSPELDDELPMQARLIHTRYIGASRLEVSCRVVLGDDIKAKKRGLEKYADKVLGITPPLEAALDAAQQAVIDVEKTKGAIRKEKP